ncbi:MAG: TonB-dependent receptor [Bryobacter sp.]|nr:TonB-dependent receptor [Bryobacter sp.]
MLRSVVGFLLGIAACWALEVRVLDASGRPMAAQVLVENLGNGVRVVSRLDDSGAKTLDLPSGRYRILVTREGFAPQQSTIEYNANAPLSLELRLSPGAPSYQIEVVGVAPLAGSERQRDEVPVPLQTASAESLSLSGALDLTDFLNRRMQSVYLNEIQNNPLQPDLNYRGYTASPLLGTPQGISVYMDGLRWNQPFGEVMSWDLLPRLAIAEASLQPGSNPVFGLNTLGGALSLRTKDGLSHPGTVLSFSGGSFGRKLTEIQHGASLPMGFHYFLAGSFLFEDGWRATSPTSARQLFANLGRQWGKNAVTLSLGYANNSLLGNGLQEQQLLAQDYRSVYTKPDQTDNRAPWLNLRFRRALSPRWNVSANVYYRYIRTFTMNGDINEESLESPVYLPGVENANNTPFPQALCLEAVEEDDDADELCNGLLNRGRIFQRNYGFGLQANWSGAGHQATFGAAYDGNRVGFAQSSEFGFLNPDRTVTGLNAFGDAVGLSSRVHSWSGYAVDTFRLGDRGHLTISGRYNNALIDNRDLLIPQAGTGSLTGRHRFQRFNPAAGFTTRIVPALHAYFNYSEGNRAPSAIELGCADPEAPCRLPNALAGDPPLNQVVTRTLEAGVRSPQEDKLRWSAGWFRASNRDDILFVASERTGFGYFRNFGRTLRQGMELDFSSRLGRFTFGGGYTFLDATFQSPEEVNGTGNSTNEENLEGVPGQEGTIEISPGNRIPLTPRHMTKSHLDVQATSKLLLHAGVIGISGSFARGNENNLHQPDGVFYIGDGRTPGYAIANLGGSYQLHPRVQLFVNVNNLFDKRYYTSSQLGPNGFRPDGRFVAQPFPPIDDEFPVQGSTFLAPGAPRAAWAGLRFRF